MVKHLAIVCLFALVTLPLYGAAAGDKLIVQGVVGEGAGSSCCKVNARFNLDNTALNSLPKDSKGKKVSIAGATVTLTFTAGSAYP